jgi:TonB-linked SusC/RagA family outer membrane protein
MTNFRRLIAVLIAATVAPATLAAQEAATVTGRVTNAQGQPEAAVSVRIESLNVGASTGADGNYRLVVPGARLRAGQSVTITASRQGLSPVSRTITLSPGANLTQNFQMATNVLLLEDVVVTGVAGPTSRAVVPFEIAKINAEDLPVPSLNGPGGAIQGKVAGARVVQASGTPGTAPAIILRAPTAINAQGRSQEPLYIVDGVILGGGLQGIDAQDIESIEVVKGAAAASLYGSRAANGVVQVTTKRGRNLGGNRTRYTFRSEYGQQDIEGSIDLSDYHIYRLNSSGSAFQCRQGSAGALRECGYQDTYVNSAGVRVAYDLVPDRYAGAAAGANQDFVTFADKAYPGQNFDQVEAVFDPGSSLNSFLGVEGSAGNTNFYASFGVQDQSGVVRNNNGYQQRNVRLNLDHGIGETLQLQANGYYSLGTSDVIDARNVFQSLTHQLPLTDLLAVDSVTGQLRIQPNVRDTEYQNPLYDVYYRDITDETQRFTGGFVGRYAPADWVNVEGNVSYDRVDFGREDYRPRGFQTLIPSLDINGGTLSRENQVTDALNVSGTATFSRSFGDLNARFQTRYLYEEQNQNYFGTSGARFVAVDVPRFDNTDRTRLSSSSNSNSIRAQGYYGITNLNYSDRYIIDALIRRDGSSLFGSDERWQTYYRLATAWRVSEEPWFNVPAVDGLKLHYSYGTAGGRPSFAAQYETYAVSTAGITPVNLGNTQLKPEFSAEHEAGIDLDLFDRLTASVVYARTRTEDQILPVPLPAYFGFTSQWQNAGTLESNTWEASLEASLLRRDNMNWSTRLIYDRTRQEITEMNVPCFRNTVDANGGATQGIETAFYFCEGSALGTFYGVQFAEDLNDLPEGVDRSLFQVNDEGYVVYVGNGNSYTEGFTKNLWGTTSTITNPVTGGVFNWGIPVVSSQLAELGSTQPDFNLSFSSDFNWGGLQLYGLLDSSFGFDIYNQTRQWSLFNQRGGELDQAGKDSTLYKPVGYYSSSSGLYNALGPNSHFVEDGSFVKLRELAVRYTLGESLLGRVPGVSALDRVTVGLIGRNLVTWTDYSGYDPEVGYSGGRAGSAVLNRFDRYGYPNFRTLTASVEIGF